MSLIETMWPHLATAALTLLSIVTSAHVVLNKRDTRSAVVWIGLIVLMPLVGVVLYALLGVNRITRHGVRQRHDSGQEASCAPPPYVVSEAELPSALSPRARELVPLTLLMERTTSRPLLSGHRVEPLRNGDEAYPAMLDAIAHAKRSIALETYIFDDDRAGKKFVEALGAARERGVDVRVLIDDAGARYSNPPVDRRLRARKVQTARFLPILLPWALPYMNLRNHRKLLVVDGEIAFTGGMNIREACLLDEHPRYPTEDLHFRVRGPVVADLLDTFAEDWHLATGVWLEGDAWAPHVSGEGSAFARCVVVGPDHNLDVMRWSFLGAIASARRSVRIVTPYFLPDEALVTALNVAAMRGVRVDIVLPERGNLRLVAWAMRGEFWKVLGRGCRVWLTPAPFDHSKLLVVDGAFGLVGSANWDPRSFRLNFELGLECYDDALGDALDALVDEKIARARELSVEEVRAEPAWLRLRDGVARLFKPYL